MTFTWKRSGITFATFLVTLVIGTYVQASDIVTEVAGRMPSFILHPLHDDVVSDELERVAKRMQERLWRRYAIRPSIRSLSAAVSERRKMFAHAVTARIAVPNDSLHPVREHTITLHEYPTWLAFIPSDNDPHFEINESAVKRSIEEFDALGIPSPRHDTIRLVKEDKGVLRAETESVVPRDGYVFDMDEATDTIAKAWSRRGKTIDLEATFMPGKIMHETVDGTKEWTLLATGRSNFANSPWARKANIRKALHEQLHNVVVPQGEIFSFNATLGGPISYSRGWYDALIIVNGHELEPAPGGGICQAATTIYRSVLLAGLPVVKRKNHSLYVTYYKKYGVGLDATIFPGKQDFTFENDTPGELIIRAHTEEDEAYVSIYGINDGRIAHLEGPYFAATAPLDLTVNDRPLRSNEIVWRHQVVYPDGRIQQSKIVSNYNAVPRSLAAQYPTSVGMTELVHAAAD